MQRFTLTFCFLLTVAVSLRLDAGTIVQDSVNPIRDPARQQIVEDEYRIAAGHYSRSQWADAIKAFDQLIANHAETTQARWALFFKGEALIQQKNYRDAYSVFDQFIRANLDSQYLIRAKFRRAESAFFSKPAEQSVSYLESFRKEHSESDFNEFVLAYLGQVCLKTNKLDQSIATYQTCLSRYPGSSLSEKNRLGLAQALQMKGKPQLAAEQFKKVIAKKGALQAAAQIGLAHLYFRQKQFQAAEQEYQSFLQRFVDHPQSASVRYWRARSMMAQANWQQAAEAFASIEPKSVSPETGSAAAYDGAICHIKLGQLDPAKARLQFLLRSWPNSQWADEANSLLLDIAYQKNEWDEVLRQSSEFRKKFQGSALTQSVLEKTGQVFYQNQEFEKSETVFKELLEQTDSAANDLRSSRAAWKYLLAASQIGLNKYEEAINRLATIAIADQPDEFKANIAFANATANVGLKRLEAASSAYQEYLKLAPRGSHVIQANSDLTSIYCRLEQLDLAREAFDQMTRLRAEPKKLAASAVALADLAYSKSKLDWAKQYFEFVVEHAADPDLRKDGLVGIFWIFHKQNQIPERDEILVTLMNNHARQPATAKTVLAAAKSHIKNRQLEQANRLLEWIEQFHGNSEVAGLATIEHAILLRSNGMKNEIERAEQLLEQLIADAPQHPSLDAALYELAWIKLDKKASVDANVYFDRIVREYPTSKFADDAMLRLANDAFEQDDYQLAAERSRQLLERQPRQSEVSDHALLILGRSMLGQENFSEAQERLTYLLRRTERDKLRKSAAHYLADAIQRSSEPDQSFAEFRKSQKGFNPNAASLIPHINLRVCQKLAERGNLTLAREIAEKSEKRFRDFGKLYEFDYIVGRSLAEQAKFSAARERYTNVIRSPNGGSTETAAKAQWMIGETYFHQEQFAEALEAYYKVDSLFEYKNWRAAALLQAGKCQERLDNLTHARTLYRQVMKLLPDSEYAKQAKTRLDILDRQANRRSKNVK